MMRLTEWKCGATCAVLCCAKSLQSCPTLGNPVDCSLPGSSVHGILQARILEWAAMPSSRESSQPGIEPRSLAVQADSLPAALPGKLHGLLKKAESIREY